MKKQKIILLFIFNLIVACFADERDGNGIEFKFGTNYSNYKNVKGAVPGLGAQLSLCTTFPQEKGWLNKYEFQVRKNIATLEKQIIRPISDDYSYFDVDNVKSNVTSVELSIMIAKSLQIARLNEMQFYSGLSFSCEVQDHTSFEYVHKENELDANDNNISFDPNKEVNWLSQLGSSSGFGTNIGFTLRLTSLLLDFRYFYSFYNIKTLRNVSINKKLYSISASIGISFDYLKEEMRKKK